LEQAADLKEVTLRANSLYSRSFLTKVTRLDFSAMYER